MQYLQRTEQEIWREDAFRALKYTVVEHILIQNGITYDRIEQAISEVIDTPGWTGKEMSTDLREVLRKLGV